MVCPKPGVIEFLRYMHPSVPDRSTMVALLGTRGVGKTQLATVMGMHWAGAGQTVRYTTAAAMFRRVKETFGHSTESESKAIRDFVAPAFLVIDEVQDRSDSRWEDNLLTEIVDQRYVAMKTTVLISNLQHEEFIKNVGPSIYDRLCECGAVIECGWPSFRGGGSD